MGQSLMPFAWQRRICLMSQRILTERSTVLQEVPDKDWSQKYTEGQKLRARIVYIDANSKTVRTLQEQ